MTALDWIKVYAEARVAFPADVMLHTEERTSGAVEITAYRDEFEPPLPHGFKAPDGERVVQSLADGSTVVHRATTRAVRFVVRDQQRAGATAAKAARALSRP